MVWSETKTGRHNGVKFEYIVSRGEGGTWSARSRCIHKHRDHGNKLCGQAFPVGGMNQRTVTREALDKVRAHIDKMLQKGTHSAEN